MSNKQKVLITGGCSFIFSNFIRRALHEGLAKNYTFINIDKIKEKYAIHNIYNSKNHTLYIGNVADAHFVSTIFEIEKPDIVIHAAAESSVDDSINNAHPFILSNILGTQVIIDACLKYKTNRLIYMSSDEVYGQLATEDATSWTEDRPLAPRNPYSASKASSEFLIKAAHNTHGLKYNIIRSCNNYGPRQTPDKFVPKIIKNVLANQTMPIHGEGKAIREWIYVNDCCDGIIKIMQAAPENETYNVGSGLEYYNIEVFQQVCNILGKGHDLIRFVDDRKGQDARYSVNNKKLQALGWQPQTKFKEGLEETVAWYVSNQWFLRLDEPLG